MVGMEVVVVLVAAGVHSIRLGNKNPVGRSLGYKELALEFQWGKRAGALVQSEVVVVENR